MKKKLEEKEKYIKEEKEEEKYIKRKMKELRSEMK
jgi:hypothetical protein